MSSSNAPAARLPEPTRIELNERATTAIYDSGPPAGDGIEPPVVLLHGWCINSYVNFGSAYDELATDRRVVMIDLRGHGHGAPLDGQFDLDVCAEDVTRILDELGIEQATVVGYSLGGAVAQLVAKRDPERVTGLVLAATSEFFCGHLAIRWQFKGLELSAAALRRVPSPVRTPIFRSLATIFCARYPGWVRPQVLQCDPVAILEAGASLGGFNSTDWIGDLPMPVSVIVTARDRVIPTDSQYRLADDAHAVTTIQVDADHDLPVRNDPRFTDALVEAIRAVEPNRIVALR